MQRNIKIEVELWDAVKAKNLEMLKRGWPRLSVTDIIKTGLRHYLGQADMNQVFGSKYGAETVKHEDD